MNMSRSMQNALAAGLSLVMFAVLVVAFLTLLRDGHRALAIVFGITISYLVAVVMLPMPAERERTFTRTPDEEHHG